MVAVISKADLPRPRVKRGTLRVDPVLLHFVEDELLPAAGLDPRSFWPGVAAIIADLAPVNRRLLDRRVELQAKIDEWHREHRDVPRDANRYTAFLRRIGYLVEPGSPFRIATRDVDPEIATLAGPQLVVPVNNARFAINAANARWGSLFDALYGTDALPPEHGRTRAGAGYDPVRGAAVIREALGFLDRAVPLAGAKHADVIRYSVEIPTRYARLSAVLRDGRTVGLADGRQFAGWDGHGERRTLLLRNHGLHIELRIDPHHPVGRDAPGHIRDIVLESAITTIQDCEDSVAAVDAADKVLVYRNWLGLMQGTLEASFEKHGRTVTRRLNGARRYIGIDGRRLVLPGTSLMLVRNVGHLMTTEAVLDAHGEAVFEGILDAIVTTACALANTRQKNQLLNSRTGSIYIVKPKMHGPDEAAFANTLFARVEDLFGLPRNTIKIGVMDEERRTSANLGECIRAVRERIVFINTGFLDRTGDEIRTSTYAGPVLPKEAIKRRPWFDAYEDRNVDVGIACGLPGRAQIGKGMWPMPDEMNRMMATKQAHPEAGATCAWVPSPTAATLHAMHYHAVDVSRRQDELASRPIAPLAAVLTPPICNAAELDADTIRAQLDNNAQGILGYVVRWIDQGVGCSKVPDIHDIGLMEDRATLRISSQHIANWLLHGICSEAEVRETFRRMARVVDEQNAADPAYRRMSADFGASIAFQCACALVFDALAQPNGYTEPLLHEYRRRRRALDG